MWLCSALLVCTFCSQYKFHPSNKSPECFYTLFKISVDIPVGVWEIETLLSVLETVLLTFTLMKYWYYHSSNQPQQLTWAWLKIDTIGQKYMENWIFYNKFIFVLPQPNIHIHVNIHIYYQKATTSILTNNILLWCCATIL